MTNTFDGVSTETLTSNLAAIEDMPGMGQMSALIKAELAEREDNAAKLAETAAIRALADQANELLASVARSNVPSVADVDGPAFKHAARTLRELIMSAYSVSSLKAQKALMVLTDTRGQTDSDGTVTYAVEYVNSHTTSTVYRATDNS